MLFLEKLKRIFLYDGLKKSDYKKAESYIIKENNRRLRIYNIIAIIFVLGLFVYSLFIRGFESITIIYLLCAMINGVILALLCFKFQDNKIFSTITNYFFTTFFLLFSIYSGTITSNGMPATAFLATIAIIPYILYTKALSGFIHRLIILGIFIALSYKTKSPEYFRTDVINSVVVFLLSSLAGGRVRKLQVNGWVMASNQDKELEKMSANFEFIRTINLQENSSIDYARGSNKKIIGTSDNALKQMDSYIEEWVADNNLDHMRQFCDLSTLEDRMFSQKVLICDFASKDIAWRRATFIVIEEDKKGFPKKVVFTIQLIADSFYLNMLNFDLMQIK